MELDGRVTLITGAARRIGQALALRLASTGCSVALHYGRSRREAETTAEECRGLGVRAECFQADLADSHAVAKLVPEVLATMGRLDILINNASVFEEMTLERFEPEAWERTMRVNLTAPMMLSHAAADALRASRGRIVNLCDIAPWRPWPRHLAYVVSKGGLETLTKVLARALAPEVNVVGIAPGAVAWPESYDQAIRDHLTAKIPLKRAGTPEDVANAVHYLLGDGDYLTGVILPVDGGRSIA